MRMRFWATIRSPAFSISALTAPVRLRSVASGLMIEKVRSIGMFTSLQTLVGELAGLYRRSPQTASDPVTRQPIVFALVFERKTGARTRRRAPNYSNFTKVNPFCKRHPVPVQLGKSRLSDDRTLGLLIRMARGVTGGDLTEGALCAVTLRRRSCYANSRLLQLPRLRWAQPRWRRLPPRPGAAAGITVGIMVVGVGAARASSSAVRPTTA